MNDVLCELIGYDNKVYCQVCELNMGSIGILLIM